MSKVEVFSLVFPRQRRFKIKLVETESMTEMGAFDMNGKRCDTCDLPYSELAGGEGCLGHFGHINLTVPIPKLQFLGTQKYGWNLPTLFSQTPSVTHVAVHAAAGYIRRNGSQSKVCV